VDEVHQVEVVVEEVSYRFQAHFGIKLTFQDEVDHQVAEDVEDQVAVHQGAEVEGVGASREREHKGKPSRSTNSHRDRYHRCQYYADSYESVDGVMWDARRDGIKLI
jgi:hypothetical protein